MSSARPSIKEIRFKPDWDKYKLASNKLFFRELFAELDLKLAYLPHFKNENGMYPVAKVSWVPQEESYMVVFENLYLTLMIAQESIAQSAGSQPAPILESKPTEWHRYGCKDGVICLLNTGAAICPMLRRRPSFERDFQKQRMIEDWVVTEKARQQFMVINVRNSDSRIVVAKLKITTIESQPIRFTPAELAKIKLEQAVPAVSTQAQVSSVVAPLPEAATPPWVEEMRREGGVHSRESFWGRKQRVTVISCDSKDENRSSLVPAKLG